jgi:hypothetical protein
LKEKRTSQKSVLPPVKKFAKIGGEKVGQPGGQK